MCFRACSIGFVDTQTLIRRQARGESELVHSSAGAGRSGNAMGILRHPFSAWNLITEIDQAWPDSAALLISTRTKLNDLTIPSRNSRLSTEAGHWLIHGAATTQPASTSTRARCPAVCCALTRAAIMLLCKHCTYLAAFSRTSALPTAHQ